MVERQTQSACLQAPLVLAVDDDEDSLVLLAGVLEILGWSCVTAGDGETALAQVKLHRPDLILLDIVLPDVNGLELLSQLKQVCPTHSTIAIAVTGLALAEEREKIQQAGFDDYICKPYLLTDLEALLWKHLKGKTPTLSALEVGLTA
ncbi:MAG: response regulator [Cyanobacteriota bacterium]|nr:response regulator [Cyanobacteriota bacterium]